MKPKPSVRYRGVTYFLQSSGRYYQDGRHGAEERLLHRRIWTDRRGPIPPGHVVHHINGDWQDNRIGNLALMPLAQHSREHTTHLMRTRPDFRASADRGMAKAIVKAAEWHRSPKGQQWHKGHGKRSWEGREPIKAVCSICGDSYDTYFATRSRFCSRACEQKECYQRHKTATAQCALCGAAFVFNKFRRQECCSRRCAIRKRNDLLP